MITFFQNCGQVFESPVIDMPSSDISASAFGGFNYVSYSAACEEPLIDLYKQTYYPFLLQQCGACHTNGPGVGQFGHSDLNTSYEAFRGLTRSRIERNAVNPNHQPPYTGVQHQTIVMGYDPYWDQAEAEFDICAGTNMSGNGIVSIGKSNSLILQRASTPNAWTRLEWDLTTESSDPTLRNKLPLIVGIETRVATISGVRQGYEFRNPTVRIKTGSAGPWRMISMHLHVNGRKLIDVSTYSLIDVSINSTTDTNISPNTSYALAVSSPLSASDTFAIEFADIRNSAGGSVAPTPTPTPAPTPTLPTSVTLTQLLSNDTTLGVFGQSCVGCHNSGVSSGGLDLTSAVMAQSAAPQIYNRMNNAGNPMPPSGLLIQEKRDVVRIWVEGGAAP